MKAAMARMRNNIRQSGRPDLGNDLPPWPSSAPDGAGAEPHARRHDASRVVVRQGGPGTPFTAGPFPRRSAREKTVMQLARIPLPRPLARLETEIATQERGRGRWATEAERLEATGRNS